MGKKLTASNSFQPCSAGRTTRGNVNVDTPTFQETVLLSEPNQSDHQGCLSAKYKTYAARRAAEWTFAGTTDTRSPA